MSSGDLDSSFYSTLSIQPSLLYWNYRLMSRLARKLSIHDFFLRKRERFVRTRWVDSGLGHYSEIFCVAKWLGTVLGCFGRRPHVEWSGYLFLWWLLMQQELQIWVVTFADSPSLAAGWKLVFFSDNVRSRLRHIWKVIAFLFTDVKNQRFGLGRVN